jgi:hypothetical protein
MSSRTLFLKTRFLERGKTLENMLGVSVGSSLRKLGSNQDVFQGNIVSNAEAKKFMIGFSPLISCSITTYS